MALGLASCVETPDPMLVTVAATAASPSTLEAEVYPVGAGHRWELVLQPAESSVGAPAGGTLVSFTPDRRGVYVVEHWLEEHLAEQLTHQFVITARGAEPTAVIATSGAATVGSTITLDGTTSVSPEQRALDYAWRLVTRPRGSAATLADAAAATTTLQLDGAGRYKLELDVFDGELWSVEPAVLLIDVP